MTISQKPKELKYAPNIYCHEVHVTLLPHPVVLAHINNCISLINAFRKSVVTAINTSKTYHEDIIKEIEVLTALDSSIQLGLGRYEFLLGLKDTLSSYRKLEANGNNEAVDKMLLEPSKNSKQRVSFLAESLDNDGSIWSLLLPGGYPINIFAQNAEQRDILNKIDLNKILVVDIVRHPIADISKPGKFGLEIIFHVLDDKTKVKSVKSVLKQGLEGTWIP